MPKKKKQSSLDSRSVFRAADIAISPSHAIVVKYVVGRSLQCTRDAAPGSNIASEKLLEQKLSSIFLLYSEKKKTNEQTMMDVISEVQTEYCDAKVSMNLHIFYRKDIIKL